LIAIHENSTTEMSSTKQDRQCTYNVILNHIPANIAAVEEQ